MKKYFFAISMLLAMAALAGCAPVYRGTDALIKKAREEMPLSSAESIDVTYAGTCSRGDMALIWFVAGDVHQDRYYYPMEVEIVGEDEYRFVHSYKPMERGRDIAALMWCGGYAFIVNNPDCSAIIITDGAGNKRTHTIEHDAYPYVLYEGQQISEYIFLRRDGSVVD